MNEEKEFLTIRELANKLRIHENTVRRAIQKGRIQAFRVGIGSRSTFRIPATEVNRICELDMTKLIESIVQRKLDERELEVQNGATD